MPQECEVPESQLRSWLRAWKQAQPKGGQSIDGDRLFGALAPLIRWVGMALLDPKHIAFDDMLSAGQLALVEWLGVFDESRGMTVRSYARLVAKHAMLSFLVRERIYRRGPRHATPDQSPGELILPLAGGGEPVAGNDGNRPDPQPELHLAGEAQLLLPHVKTFFLEGPCLKKREGNAGNALKRRYFNLRIKSGLPLVEIAVVLGLRHNTLVVIALRLRQCFARELAKPGAEWISDWLMQLA